MKLLGALILPIVLLGAIIIYKILVVAYEDEREANAREQVGRLTNLNWYDEYGH